MITWDDIDTYLNAQLKKPNILDPAVYVDLGMVALSVIPYKVINTGNLRMCGDNFFNIHDNDSYFKLLVEHNGKAEDFYVINKHASTTENACKDSHNSHLKFGHGKLPLFNIPKLPWSETIGKADDIRMNWWDECVAAAKQIYDRYKLVAVTLSGGLDSELAVCAFLDAGVKFKTVFMVYRDLKGNVINDYDYKYVLDFCKINDIDLMKIDVNIIADLSDYRYRDYYIDNQPETQFLVSGLYTHHLIIETMNNLGYVVVMGSDQVELKKDANQNICMGETSFTVGLAAPTWAHLTGKTCIYNFFFYTASQVVSYLDIPEVQNATAIDYKFKDYVCRKYGSKRLGPKRDKATGYEKLSYVFRKQLNKEYHILTADNIDFVDWEQHTSTQYIHRISKIVECGYYNDWQIIRTTPNDFLGKGFIDGDSRYFDL